MQKNLWLPVALLLLSACTPVQTSHSIHSKYDETFVVEGGKQMSENKYSVIKDKITYIVDLSKHDLNITLQNHTGSDITILWEKSNVKTSGGETLKVKGFFMGKPGETSTAAGPMTQIAAGTSAHLSIHPRPLVEPRPGEGIIQVFLFVPSTYAQSVVLNLQIAKGSEILTHNFTIQYKATCKTGTPSYGGYC